MLNRLRFTNFKSWERADLQCGSITGVFGTNSSGKTSLLQFLLLLKQTKEATDRAISLDLNGNFVELGAIRDAIHCHDETKVISIDLTFQLASELSLANPSKKRTSTVARGNILGFKADVGVHQRAPVARFITYSLGDMEFTLGPRKGEATPFELRAVSLSENKTDFSFKRTLGRPWQLPGPIKSYAFPDQARTYFQNSGFLSDLEVAYEAQLDKIFYLGPLRQYPQRDYLWARSRPSDVGQRGEKVIDAILAATEAQEKRNLRSKSRLMPFQAMIAHWLRAMGLIDSFKVEEIADGSNRWQAKIRTKPGASEVFLTDVGFGVSQVLPVITILQYVPEGSTVVLEQPEIHLHPLAQAGLADVIIQAAVHRKVQVILESHSEHLLLRLQRRIAEKEIKSSDVKLYFCDTRGGVSALTNLEVDLYGSIRNWPDHFMGDAFTETAEAELARIKRMRVNQ